MLNLHIAAIATCLAAAKVIYGPIPKLIVPIIIYIRYSLMVHLIAALVLSVVTIHLHQQTFYSVFTDLHDVLQRPQSTVELAYSYFNLNTVFAVAFC